MSRCEPTFGQFSHFLGSTPLMCSKMCILDFKKLKILLPNLLLGRPIYFQKSLIWPSIGPRIWCQATYIFLHSCLTCVNIHAPKIPMIQLKQVVPYLKRYMLFNWKSLTTINAEISFKLQDIEILFAY